MSSKKACQPLLFSSTYLRRRKPTPEISIGYSPNSAQNALQVLKIGLSHRSSSSSQALAGCRGRMSGVLHRERLVAGDRGVE
jgi:hypothetical protein